MRRCEIEDEEWLRAQDLALDCRRAQPRVSRKRQQSQLLPYLPMSQGHRIHSSDTMCLTGSVWDVSHNWVLFAMLRPDVPSPNVEAEDRFRWHFWNAMNHLSPAKNVHRQEFLRLWLGHLAQRNWSRVVCRPQFFTKFRIRWHR